VPIADTGAEGTALHRVQRYIILNNAKILYCWVNSDFIFYGSTCILRNEKAGRKSSDGLRRAEVARRGRELNSAPTPSAPLLCRFQKGLWRQHTQLRSLQFNSILLTLHLCFSNIWGPVVLEVNSHGIRNVLSSSNFVTC